MKWFMNKYYYFRVSVNFKASYAIVLKFMKRLLKMHYKQYLERFFFSKILLKIIEKKKFPIKCTQYM